MNPFVVGQEYVRREIHSQYKGSSQSGISPCRDHPMIFLFTGASGEQYGYEDRWHDGVFWYTGEGRIGDMQLTRGNLAITRAAARRRALLLFEQKSRGRARFVGEAHYITHRFEAGKDQNGHARRVIVFELTVQSPSPSDGCGAPDLREEALPRSGASQHVSLAELRRQALAIVPPNASVEAQLKNVYYRNRKVREYVLRRAAGVCENCGTPAPFKALSGDLYLEPHHVTRRADDGPDHPRWVAAICPNCHREIHYGMDGVRINRRLIEKLGIIESD